MCFNVRYFNDLCVQDNECAEKKFFHSFTNMTKFPTHYETLAPTLGAAMLFSNGLERPSNLIKKWCCIITIFKFLSDFGSL